MLPCEEHVADLVQFALDWDRKAPLLIHCWAGISRSTAAAFITLCALNPQADEFGLAESAAPSLRHRLSEPPAGGARR